MIIKAGSLALALALCLFAGGCALRGAGNSAATASPEATVVATPGATVAAAGYSNITAEEAKERMDSGRDVVVVDVRTQAEYDAGHIPGAIVIPNETIGKEMPAELPDLNAEILVYCRSGNRSQQASRKLAALGYTGIYEFGGIVDWPYDVVTE